MKAKDLKVGESYAWQQGKYGEASRIEILEIKAEQRRDWSGTTKRGARVKAHHYGSRFPVETIAPYNQIISTWEDYQEAKEKDRQRREAAQERRDKKNSEYLAKLAGTQPFQEKMGIKVWVNERYGTVFLSVDVKDVDKFLDWMVENAQ